MKRQRVLRMRAIARNSDSVVDHLLFDLQVQQPCP